MEIPNELIGRYTIDPATGCWNWTTHRDGRPDGYGRIHVKIDGKWKTKAPHRLMLIAVSGIEPLGMDAMHSCDNRGCINPAHLSWGTRKENYWDSRRKDRQPNVNKTHCKRGHPLSGENLHVHPRMRVCKECRKIRGRDQDSTEARRVRKLTPEYKAYMSAYQARYYQEKQKTKRQQNGAYAAYMRQYYQEKLKPKRQGLG